MDKNKINEIEVVDAQEIKPCKCDDCKCDKSKNQNNEDSKS